jgi:hypothetical protein
LATGSSISAFAGAPIDPERRFRVAINNYRLNGGGGYRMFRNARVIDQANQEIRELMIDWVRRHPEIRSTPNDNWRIVPGSGHPKPKPPGPPANTLPAAVGSKVGKGKPGGPAALSRSRFIPDCRLSRKRRLSPKTRPVQRAGALRGQESPKR